MKSTIQFYKKFGKIGNKVMGMLKLEPILKGVPVPFKQTPGRAQYYYTETLHLIPDSILYQIKMPSKFAQSEESKKYNDIVEREIIKYLEHKFKHNLFDPKNGLNLDLTVMQVKYLLKANEDHFNKAESGELQKIIDNYNTTLKAKDESQEKLEEYIETTLERVEAYTKETYAIYKKTSMEKSLTILDFNFSYG